MLTGKVLIDDLLRILFQSLLSSLAFALALTSASASGFVISLITWKPLVVFNGYDILLDLLDAISLIHELNVGFPVGRLLAVEIVERVIGLRVAVAVNVLLHLE